MDKGLTEKATLKNSAKVYITHSFHVFEICMDCSKVIKHRGPYLLISSCKSLRFSINVMQ